MSDLRVRASTVSSTNHLNNTSQIRGEIPISSGVTQSREVSQTRELTKRKIQDNLQGKFSKALGAVDSFRESDNSGISQKVDYKKLSEDLRELGITLSPSYLQDTFKGKEKAAVEYSKLVEAMKKGEIAPSVRKAMNQTEFPYEDSFKRRLLLDSIKVMRYPRTITQGSKGTCGATVAERALAERKPEEYLRLVRELVTKGSAKLANGDEMKLNPGGVSLTAKEAKSEKRLLTSRILQPTFMDYADGDLKYLDDKDGREGIFNRYLGGSGLWGKDMARLMTGLFGEKYEVISMGRESIEAVKDYLREAASHSKEAPQVIAVNYTANPLDLFFSGHYLELKGVSGDKVKLSNPWGNSKLDLNTGKVSYNPGGIEEQSLNKVAEKALYLVVPKREAEVIKERVRERHPENALAY